MGLTARNLLLHPLVRGGLYGLAFALAVQSFFDDWKWWIFTLWGVAMVICTGLAVRDLRQGDSEATQHPPRP